MAFRLLEPHRHRRQPAATCRAAARAQQGAGDNPLESLSLDIGRLMDRNLAAEMWDRYQRGESKAFTKRLYTPGRPEGVRRGRPQISRRPQLQADGRPLHHRVRAAARRGRARRARPAALRGHLTSETGLVYTLLAHAAGRLG